MDKILEEIRQVGFVPLIALEKKEDAVPLARALSAGGIPIAEVTFRTDAALDVIKEITAHVPEVLVGAGTVHSPEQAEQAVKAGAAFLVTPGFNREVVSWCIRNQVPVLPGTAVPCDLEQVLAFGLHACKFFPAEVCGGVKALKSLKGPYGDMQFMPTGGVNEDNMLDYLALPNVLAVGGSFLCPDALVREKKWEEISALCRRLIFRMLGFELAHVGINTRDAEEARQTADRLGSLFGKEVNELPGAYFAGSIAEVVKGKFLGDMGHIGINTRDIDRAVAYFRRRGVELDMDTAVYNDKGQLGAIYLKECISGFAVHLRRA